MSWFDKFCKSCKKPYDVCDPSDWWAHINDESGTHDEVLACSETCRDKLINEGVE